jgi:signal transduction histidine kinase
MTPLLVRIRQVLPRGTTLTEESWQTRHHILLGILALHLPLLVVVGILGGRAAPTVLAEITPLAVITVVGLLPIGRTARSLATTVGLSGTSALLVHLTGGLVEAHFHYFLTLGLIALYQDWRPYLAALAAVVVHHGVVGLVMPESAFSRNSAVTSPWLWAVLHGGFIFAVGITHLVFWKVTEREQARSQELWQRLFEGERAVVEQLRAAESLKSELFAVVSHEFRTPLTSIIGFSHTLMARADTLEPATIRTCVRNIDQQSRRLARLVHNVLAAAGDIAADPTAVTDLSVVSHHVAREVSDAYEDASPVEVRAPDVLRAAIDNDAAYRVLTNLVDNAVKFSVPGTSVGLDAHMDDGHVVVQVANEASPLSAEQMEAMFTPFVQADSSDSRPADGIGLGLHVVRRLLDAYEGDVSVDHADGRIVLRARIPQATRPPITLPESAVTVP